MKVACTADNNYVHLLKVIHSVSLLLLGISLSVELPIATTQNEYVSLSFRLSVMFNDVVLTV